MQYLNYRGSFYKIRQYSFIVEYVYLAFICILIIRRFEPTGHDFGLYLPLMADIYLALIYSVVLYIYRHNEKEPAPIESILRFIYLFVAAKLMIETSNPIVQIIIILPTVIVALRYPLRYTVLTAFMTTIVILFSVKKYNSNLEFDYLFIFLSFIWVLGLLVSSSMEVERQVQIERRKMMEKENLAALGQMAAGIAHEVRNPLTTIKGFVQLLDKQKSLGQSPVVKEYLTMIDTEIDRMNNLLKDFLQFAKPGKPKLMLNSIAKLITDMNSLLGAQCLSKGIRLFTDMPNDIPEVQCDKNQLKQVIVNIALNAIDAMLQSEEKILRIAATFDHKYVYIRISDTGSGMTPEQIVKIFVPFYTTKETGTGLGLSVCYSIIENHQGKIKVESEPGIGTSFIISLPYKNEETFEMWVDD